MSGQTKTQFEQRKATLEAELAGVDAQARQAFGNTPDAERFARNRKENIKADLDRVEIRLRALQEAEQRGVDPGDRLKELKQGEAAAERARLGDDELARREAQRQVVRVEQEVVQARLRGQQTNGGVSSRVAEARARQAQIPTQAEINRRIAQAQRDRFVASGQSLPESVTNRPRPQGVTTREEVERQRFIREQGTTAVGVQATRDTGRGVGQLIVTEGRAVEKAGTLQRQLRGGVFEPAQARQDPSRLVGVRQGELVDVGSRGVTITRQENGRQVSEGTFRKIKIGVQPSSNENGTQSSRRDGSGELGQDDSGYSIRPSASRTLGLVVSASPEGSEARGKAFSGAQKRLKDLLIDAPARGLSKGGILLAEQSPLFIKGRLPAQLGLKSTTPTPTSLASKVVPAEFLPPQTAKERLRDQDIQNVIVGSTFSGVAPLIPTAASVIGTGIGLAAIGGAGKSFVENPTPEQLGESTVIAGVGVAGIALSQNANVKLRETTEIPLVTGGVAKVTSVGVGVPGTGRGTVLATRVKTPTGSRTTLGRADLSQELSLIPEGADVKIGGPLETAQIRGTLERSALSTPRAQEAIPVAQTIIRGTQRTSAKALEKIPLTTERLSEEGVKVVLGVAKEEKAVVFGSFARQTQGVKLTPRDIDIRLANADQATIARVEGTLLSRLKTAGVEARSVPGKPGAIEARQLGGGFEKVLELKGKELGPGEEAVPEFVIGFRKEGQATTIQGQKFTTLNEELRGVTQGVVRVKTTPASDTGAVASSAPIERAIVTEKSTLSTGSGTIDVSRLALRAGERDITLLSKTTVRPTFTQDFRLSPQNVKVTPEQAAFVATPQSVTRLGEPRVASLSVTSKAREALTVVPKNEGFLTVEQASRRARLRALGDKFPRFSRASSRASDPLVQVERTGFTDLAEVERNTPIAQADILLRNNPKGNPLLTVERDGFTDLATLRRETPVARADILVRKGAPSSPLVQVEKQEFTDLATLRRNTPVASVDVRLAKQPKGDPLVRVERQDFVGLDTLKRETPIARVDVRVEKPTPSGPAVQVESVDFIGLDTLKGVVRRERPLAQIIVEKPKPGAPAVSVEPVEFLEFGSLQGRLARNKPLARADIVLERRPAGDPFVRVEREGFVPLEDIGPFVPRSTSIPLPQAVKTVPRAVRATTRRAVESGVEAANRANPFFDIVPQERVVVSARRSSVPVPENAKPVVSEPASTGGTRIDIGPPPKREKDVQSVIETAKTLQQSQFVPRPRLSRAITRFEQLFAPEASAATGQVVKVPMRDFSPRASASRPQLFSPAVASPTARSSFSQSSSVSSPVMRNGDASFSPASPSLSPVSSPLSPVVKVTLSQASPSPSRIEESPSAFSPSSSPSSSASPSPSPISEPLSSSSSSSSEDSPSPVPIIDSPSIVGSPSPSSSASSSSSFSPSPPSVTSSSSSSSSSSSGFSFGRRRPPQRPPRFPTFDEVEGSTQGFRVFAKIGGEFQSLSRGALSRNAALALGARFVTGSPSATFKIVEAGRISARPDDEPSQSELSTLLRQFREPARAQPRFLRVGDLGDLDRRPSPPPKFATTFVERTRFRIDSPGELRGITFKGIQARQLESQGRRLTLPKLRGARA